MAAVPLFRIYMANCHWLLQKASLAEMNAIELYVNLFDSSDSFVDPLKATNII